MASGPVRRANRPNTWLHRPAMRRDDFPCQLGAVHTWHFSDIRAARDQTRNLSIREVAPAVRRLTRSLLAILSLCYNIMYVKL